LECEPDPSRHDSIGSRRATNIQRRPLARNIITVMGTSPGF
jgi:hypothetical protein